MPGYKQNRMLKALCSHGLVREIDVGTETSKYAQCQVMSTAMKKPRAKVRGQRVSGRGLPFYLFIF